MKAEEVRLLVTLKAGAQVWERGTVLKAPFPTDIRKEIELGNPLIEVLSVSQPDKEEEKEKESLEVSLKPSPTSLTEEKKTPLLLRRKK